MKDVLKDQAKKLPLSHLVVQKILEAEQVQTDESRRIGIKAFRTSAFFPAPFYKNITRDISLSKHENH